MSHWFLERLNWSAKFPTKGTEGSACFDIYASESKDIAEFDTEIVCTGWRIEIDPGYEVVVRSRSGNSVKGLVVANAPGTIDSDYRGELKVILYNQSGMPWRIEAGDKIAQCRIQRLEADDAPEQVEELSESKSRGEGGFGHTGR